MFKLYSKGCEYALRALVQISSSDSDKRFSPKDVCRKADIPEAYTRKVFQALVEGGFLDSITGPGGGYALKRRSDQISLLQIIHAVDGEDTFKQCVMGLSECDNKKPCPVHEVWKRMRKNLTLELKAQTLQDLIETKKTRKMKA